MPDKPRFFGMADVPCSFFKSAPTLSKFPPASALAGPREPADSKAFANVIKLSPIAPLFVAIMSLLLLLLSRCSAAVIPLLLPLFFAPVAGRNTNVFSSLDDTPVNGPKFRIKSVARKARY